jgi:hypothetical protein
MEPSRRRSRLAALLALILVPALTACTSAPTGPASPGASPGSAVREIPLDPYLGRLRTLDVTVAGETLPFLFDTAGGVTLLTVEAAERAGCEPFGAGVGFRHDGSPVTLSRCRGVELAIGGHPTRDEEVAVWDLMALLQGAPEVGGLVSLKSFEGEIVSLDLGAGRLRVETEESLARAIAGAVPLTVRDARQGGGASLDLFVAVESPAGPLWFELDSGALSPVLVAPHAAELLGLDLSADEARSVELPVAGLGPVRVDAQLKEGLIYDGLLNAAFLEELVVTLDLEEIRAWARRK